MIRLTVPSLAQVESLKEIKSRLRAAGIETPLVADVHFSSEIAIAAAEVVEKVRINPGNFHKDHEKAREQFSRLVEVCKRNGTAVRIGLNHGSLGERITGLYGNNTEKGLREKLSEMPDVSPLEIRLAAEYHLDEGFMAHVESEEPMLTLGNDYVLVEYGLGAGRASHQNELFETALSGKNIIIAHPERYAFVAEERDFSELDKLTNKKYALQLNLLSLTGFHGPKSRRAAEKLLLAGRYTFVGSDTHSRLYTKAIREGIISHKTVAPLKKLMANNKQILWKL
jgi:tyrosine-protein phosphatase YwqE